MATWILIFIMVLLKFTSALIAYDCGHEKMNRTRISLLTIEECNVKVPEIHHESEDIQLLEINEVATIHIYQCKINIVQSIYYCGMFSHLSLVPGGLSSFIIEITQEECLKIQNNGTYLLPNSKLISDIRANASTRGTEVIAGVLDSNGYCKGTHYSYGSNSWNDVIVMHAFEFTILDYFGSVRLEDNQVILRNNILCPYLQRQCMDVEFGMSFWDLIPDTSCETMKYNVLYEGSATKIQNLVSHNDSTRIIYTVNSEEVLFALEITEPISVCGYDGFQTEHPRLLIAKKTISGYPFNKGTVNSRNLNLLTYVNTKFVYVERHIKSQIESLYTNLILKKCELERDVLKMQLAVAHHHPAEFAFMRMKRLGYTAISRGEVIYIIKCQPVEVTIRKTTRCFNELPVNYNNNSYFMTPTTHLLQEYGTEIPCSPILSPAYFLHGSWYGFDPQGHRLENPDPDTLRPSEGTPWKYEDAQHLIEAGIYTVESTEALRRQIMYPMERHALGNIITKAVTGHDVDHQNTNILHLFSRKNFDQLFGHLEDAWWFFSGFASICSSIMGIWFIIRILKFIFCFIMNLKMIKMTYGKSWWLLAAVCSPITSYILHKRSQQATSESKDRFTTIEIEPQSSQTETTKSTQSSTNKITLESLRQQTRLHPSLRT